MTEDSAQQGRRRGISRRGFVKSSAALGGLAAMWSAAPAAARAAAPSAASCTNIPNKYNIPFSVCDDEFFIFAVNYKPFEYTVDDATRTATRVFNTIIGDALQAKFPNLKIKYATWDYPIRYEDLDAAGVIPDLILEDPRSRIDRDLEPLGWVQDMTGMINDAGIDLSQLNQSTVELVKSRSDGGMYGVPVFIDEYVMLYNKKIFDKFHVPYPKIGATYDEIFRLAKRLTRQQGLDAYKGYMQHPDQYLSFNQLGLYPFLDTGSEEPKPEDVKVNLTSAGWQQVADNMYRFLEIPKNTFTTVDDYFKGDMSNPGHVAMVVDSLNRLPMYALSELYIQDGDEDSYKDFAKSVDIGVSTVPILDRKNNAIYQPDTRAAFIPKGSKNQDQALDVVKWLVSEEAQIQLSKYAIKGVLPTDNVKANFAKSIPELANVDTSAVYWGENAVVTDYKNTEYWDIPLYKVFRQHVLIDCMDVKSALQVAEQTDIPAYIKAQAAAGLTW